MTDHEHDLVVMATHGHSGVRKWMFGSVAEKVVQHSPQPVLTIHREWVKRDVKTVLVPVDLSEFSKRAVRQAETLARHFKAQLVFLHTIQQEDHPAAYSASLPSAVQAGPQLSSEVKDSLMNFTGIPEEKASYVVTIGKAYEAVAEYVEEHDVDLIVAAARGHGALEGLLLGSTAERIMRLASCPVITVR